MVTLSEEKDSWRKHFDDASENAAKAQDMGADPKPEEVFMLKFNFNSVFIKILVISIVGVIILFLARETMSFRDTQDKAVSQMSAKSKAVGQLIAAQIGGSVKFGNIAAIEEILANVAETSADEFVGAVVFDMAGSPIVGATDILPQEALSLVAQVRDSNIPEYLSDGLVTIKPITFGGKDSVVGVIISIWTADSVIEKAHAAWQETINVVAIIGAAVMAALGAIVYMAVSRPLTQLEHAVSDVAHGKYDTDIPHKSRGDEVGKIATRLEEFRIDLSKSEEIAKDSAFKSAAFEGSSAPLMVVDMDSRVLFCNETCIKLFDTVEHELSDLWPGLNPSDPIGASLSQMKALKKTLKDIETHGKDAFPVSINCAIGDRHIQIKLNSAIDEHGCMNGAVIEWSDRSASTRNAAMLDGIDQAMMRAEFSTDGQILYANQKFLSSLGLSSPGTDQNFHNLFNKSQSEHADPLSTESVTGKFVFQSSDQQNTCTTEASFVPLKGASGTIEKTLFVGQDVTVSVKQKELAEQAKRKTDEEQQEVVQNLGEALQKLSQGKLDAQLTEPFAPSYEQLRADFNSTVISLRDAVGNVAENADSIRNEIGEIASAADDLSRRTERQAATLEETATALDQLTTSVRSAAEGAEGASEKARSAQVRAKEGGEVAREAVGAMDGIKTSSQEISKITSVIDDIAFQSNLLALNAGVEAARAGEAGRGFAVVATEVRALAQRSSDAAREINALISASEEQVRSGVDLVDKTGVALSTIVESISEISDLISNIAVSAKEQSAGLQEVNSSVNELDQVTQQNAAMFEETTAASHALTNSTNSLVAAISKFEISSTRCLKQPTTVNDDLEQKTVNAGAARNQGSHFANSREHKLHQDDGWEDF
jgi:methyl-accepting chemotaxis protein